MKPVYSFFIPIYDHKIEVYNKLPTDSPYNIKGYTELTEKAVKIYLPENSKGSVVLHELCHATDFILYNIGINPDSSVQGSETRAYLLGYIWKVLSNKLYKKGVKNGSKADLV